MQSYFVFKKKKKKKNDTLPKDKMPLNNRLSSLQLM